MKQVASYHEAPVYEYTIENKVLKIHVLNFGGTISGIYFKEDHTNMVASFLNKQDYIDQGVFVQLLTMCFATVSA